MKMKSKISSVIMAILLIAVTITGNAATALAAGNPPPTSITTIYGRPAAIEVNWKKVNTAIMYATKSDYSNAASIFKADKDLDKNIYNYPVYTISNRAEGIKYYCKSQSLQDHRQQQ